MSFCYSNPRYQRIDFPLSEVHRALETGLYHFHLAAPADVIQLSRLSAVIVSPFCAWGGVGKCNSVPLTALFVPPSVAEFVRSGVSLRKAFGFPRDVVELFPREVSFGRIRHFAIGRFSGHELVWRFFAKSLPRPPAIPKRKRTHPRYLHATRQ